MILIRRATVLAAAIFIAVSTPALSAGKPFVEVGKQEAMTILVPAAPWLPAFTKIVELYEEQTGNKIKLDVHPYGGVLDKARNDLRGGTGTYDVVLLDNTWIVEMYEGGFLSPLKEIDPTFDVPKEVLTYGDSGYWNEQKRWRTSNGGKLMAFTPLGNVSLWYYRTDLLAAAGLQPPKTVQDVLASCAKLTKPPVAYGAVLRGERGNPIRYDWNNWMYGYGGSIVKDPENGDFNVTLNSPQNKDALDAYVAVARQCGVPNPGAVSQGEVIQLVSVGKAAQAQIVLAAWASMQDPKKSAVAGKLGVVPTPSGPQGNKGSAIGNWNYAVPKGANPMRKKSALAFATWFLTFEAQYAYAKAGGIPNRSDVLVSDLAKVPDTSWMPAYLEAVKSGRQELGYREGSQVESALGLRLNQALIGELSSAKALNMAAKDIKDIFEKSGRKTSLGNALPE